MAETSNEASARLLDSVLKDAGVPALIQRAPGFDVPDFLSSGLGDVQVPGALFEEAQQTLEDTADPGSYGRSGPRGSLPAL